MFEQYIDQARRRLSGVLVQQQGMNENDAHNAAEATGRAFLEMVKTQLDEKNYTVLDEALSGDVTLATHSTIQRLIDPLSEKVAVKTGFDVAKSKNIVTALLPVVFNMFNDQVRDAKAKGVDLRDMVKQFSSGGGLGGLNFGNMGALMDVAKGFMKNSRANDVPDSNN